MPLSKQENRFSRFSLFSEALRDSLALEILPDRITHPSKFGTADLRHDRYHTAREQADELLEDFDNEYEKLIQYYFWKGLNDKDAKHETELYITGPVGCGKSTFVDYYIRHFCPEKGLHPAEFNKKLCIYFDARGLEYHKDANESFYNGIQEVIENKCKEFNLSLPKHSHSGGIGRAKETLRMLSDFCQESNEFEYLVLILDNLDNCLASVQKQVIRYVQEIQKYKYIKLYRVIIPLWPTTFEHFAETTEALTVAKPRISLGPPVQNGFIEKRLNVVQDQIINGTKISVHSSGSSVTFEDSEEFQNYVRFVFNSLENEQIGRLIRRLCNGDLRRELWVWEGIIRSQAAYNLYKIHLKDQSRSFKYEWMESLIAGDRRTRGRTKSRIANLFTMHHESISPRDLLAGYYGCQLLSPEKAGRRSWYDALIQLGYSEKHLETLEKNFRGFNLIHPIPSDYMDYQNDDFEVHLNSVKAYIAMFSDPAYIDNMAMITPVDQLTEQKIYETVGHLSSDLEKRVASSTAFIEYIYQKETDFLNDYKLLHKHNNSDLLAAGLWLKKQKLLSASQIISQKYRKRLEGLINSGFINWKDDWVRDCVTRLQNINPPKYLL